MIQGGQKTIGNKPVRNKAETAIDLPDPDRIENFFLYYDRFLPFLSVITRLACF